MAVDKRLPAVYVDIEDRSYVSEAIEGGRTAYVVIISDRGPHNQVVELNSRQDLYDLFGKPNFVRFGHGHYLADQHLKHSGKLYVVRPVIFEPMEGMSRSDCAAIANRFVRLNTGNNVAKAIPDNFVINEGSNILTPTDFAGSPEKCPRAVIELPLGKSIQTNIDYIEFKIGADIDQIVITNSVLSQMISNSGYSDVSKHLWLKFTTGLTSNTITCEIISDPSNGITCSTVPFDFCNYVRPYESTSTGDTTKSNAQYVTGTPVVQKIIKFEDIKPEDISLYDRIENVKANKYGSGSEASFDADRMPDTLVIDQSNIDQIKSTAGYDWDTNECKVNVSCRSGYLTLEASSASPGVPNFANSPSTLATSVLYKDYTPSSIAGSILPYVAELPAGQTPGNIFSLNVGDIIFKQGPLEENTEKYTILSIDEETNQVILDHPAIETYSGPFSKYVQIELDSIPFMTSVKNIDTLDDSILWNFYVVGAGKYYNGIYIKGVRNTTYDRMFTDDDGNPEYPYSFMDIAIYRDNGDNTVTMLEGPWTVSLIEKTSKDVIIVDIYTGLQLYLPVVINRKSRIVRVEESRAVDTMVTPNVPAPYQPDTEKRILLQNLISGKYGDNPDGIRLTGGSDGNMFDNVGRLVMTDALKAIVSQAYNGSLKSEDGSIEKLLSVVYPWYYLNYVYVGGWDHNVNYAAKELVDERHDCLLLSDTGAYMESHSEDMNARRYLVPWNTWNAALYTNYRKIFDQFTSKYFWVTPVYHAIDRHLFVDDRYWIAEPVAGIEKGAIEEAITLAYSTNETQLADEIDVELNPVIVESDGTYLLQQFTTWKRLSILKRQHVVKFLHYCVQELPKRLKDILFRKASNFWISQAQGRVNSFMSKFLDKGESDRYAAIKSFDAQCLFDEEQSELHVLLTIYPIRAIERISVNIIVK